MRSIPLLPPLLVLLALAAAPVAAQSGSFGASMLVAENELIIAEPNANFRPGTVWVYRRAASGWTEAQRLQARTPQRADGFGTVLARAGDRLFVGQKAGPVHVFEKRGGEWRATGIVDGTEGIGPQPTQGGEAARWGDLGGVPMGCNPYGYCQTEFGVTLAAAGEWLLVGEPGPTGADQGRSHQAARGGTVRSGPGIVHLFRRDASGSWTMAGVLQPSSGVPGDRFGHTVALADGRALIGAPGWSGQGADGAGQVFEFVLENGQWREVGALESAREPGVAFGASIAQSGGVAVIGAPGSGNGHGAAFVYRRDQGGTWREDARLAAYTGRRGDGFGAAVALAGADVWVGAPTERGLETGRVYVYRGGAAPEAPADAPRRLALTETVERDAFGGRIAANDGIVTVAALGMHHQAGAVVVYEKSAGEWKQTGRLMSPPDALEPIVRNRVECDDGRVGPFDCDAVDLLAFVPISMLRAGERGRGVRTNDNWGWTDPETGREYALVGRNDGTSFVDITDPSNPVLIGDLPKTPDTPPSQLWRDIKTYGSHAFIVADGAGDHGMQVFDLRRLREVRSPPALFEPDVLYDDVASVHNIVINEETGFAYLVGSRGGGQSCGGGLHMVDIRDPLRPRFAGCYADESGGTHDAQCVVYRGPDAEYRGREICLKSNGGGNALAISDVTEKSAPRFVSRATHPNPGYMHQGWLTEDHRYFFMDDEADVIQGNVPRTRTLVWDLSDLDDPVLATEFMGSLPASAHNLYIVGDTAYQANYRYGLQVLDISDPLSPREIGSFDTAPFLSGPGFSAAWSVYPFFPSGNVIVTSMQEGLFVVRPRGATPVF